MKIFVFAGREHHKLKLQSVFDALRVGHNTRWLICNNAINIDPPSEFIVPSGEPFVHAFDYFDHNSISEIDSIVENTDFPLTEISAYISPFWSLYSLREAAELIVAFRNMIKTEKPDAVLALHSNNFFCKILLYLCQENEVKTYCFQEGLLRDRDQDTLGKQGTYAEYCDKIFVWSTRSKEKLIEAGVSKRRIIVSGMSHIDQQWAIRNNPNEYQTAYTNVRKIFGLPDEAPIILFAPPITAEYKGNLLDDIFSLAVVCSKLGAALIVRPHPTEVAQLRRYILGLSEKYGVLRIDERPSCLDLICVSNAVVTQHSTIAIEALALNIPVFEINRSSEAILQSLANKGIADMIRKGEEEEKLSNLLLGAWKIDLPTVLTWIEENLAPLDGNATKRIVDKITNA